MSKEGTQMVLPNLRNTDCENTYNTGLCCKNYWMLKHWRDDPKFKHVKWFYRAMDDSWIHMENLLWLAQQYNHSKPMVIGERVCTKVPNEYPDGGPGFLISRAVIDHPNLLESWNQAVKENKGEVLDDMIWGIYVKKNNISVIHAHGISHHKLDLQSDLYRYFLHQRGHPWPLSFRPVAYHQMRESLDYMPELDRRLHEIDYGLPHPDPYTPPNCLCMEPLHVRCGWKKELNRKKCARASGDMECLGPGPYPNPVPVVKAKLSPVK